MSVYYKENQKFVQPESCLTLILDSNAIKLKENISNNNIFKDAVYNFGGSYSGQFSKIYLSKCFIDTSIKNVNQYLNTLYYNYDGVDHEVTLDEGIYNQNSLCTALNLRIAAKYGALEIKFTYDINKHIIIANSNAAPTKKFYFRDLGFASLPQFAKFPVGVSTNDVSQIILAPDLYFTRSIIFKSQYWSKKFGLNIISNNSQYDGGLLVIPIAYPTRPIRTEMVNDANTTSFISKPIDEQNLDIDISVYDEFGHYLSDVTSVVTSDFYSITFILL